MTKQITEINPKEVETMTVVYVEALLMPNGEIIRYGKTIGWNESKGVFKEVNV